MARSNNSSGQGASSSIAGPSNTTGGVPPTPGAEEEHVDIEDDWRTAYVHTDVDIVPHRQTRDRLKACAQNWRGVHALSPSPSASPLDDGRHSPKTRVVSLHSDKTDISAFVRPPSYALHTTAPIEGQSLNAPYASTVVPSSVYLADPLRAAMALVSQAMAAPPVPDTKRSTLPHRPSIPSFPSAMRAA